jgi:hypothetical protein
MLLTFLYDWRGSEDGHVERLFKQGRTYDVAHTLACQALKEKAAYEPTNSHIESIIQHYNFKLRPIAPQHIRDEV